MYFFILYVAIIVGCVVVDQVTKAITQNGASFQVIGSFLGVKPIENKGMAYGMLADWEYSQDLFCIMTLIVLALVIVFLAKTKNRSKCFHTAIAFIVGGTLGNFIDRLTLKCVRDFIDLDLRINLLKFNCNPADVFITIGAVLFIVYVLFFDKDSFFKPKNKQEQKEEKEQV